MELRKRKRVAYAQHQVSRVNHAVSSSSISSPATSVVKPLKRPCYKSVKERDDENLQSDTTIYKESLKGLRRLIRIQNDLYYKDLTIPKYMGPSKNFQLLRIPNDLKTLKDISKDLEFLLKEMTTPTTTTTNSNEYRLSSSSEKVAQSLLSYTGSLHDHPSLICRLAELHDIDIRDISDTLINKTSNSSSKNEIKSITKKLDKPLIKAKDNSLRWPTKPTKKQQLLNNSRFNNVPLYT